MEIKRNVKLAPFTTFKIGGKAKYFCIVKKHLDIQEAFRFAKTKRLPALIMGGGSNMLISDKGYGGLVIKVANSGKEILTQKGNEIFLKVAAGESWDNIVNFAVRNKWWGIENLSHIPGSVGAMAVQNVGAYGQEASKILDSVSVFDKKTGRIKIMKAKECKFSYRRSLFNTTEKGRYLILDVVIKLNKSGKPNLSYRDLKHQFLRNNPSILDIRKAVIKIRNQKYPFPKQAKNGNAGSFFKNLILDQSSLLKLTKKIETNFGSEAVLLLEAKKFSEDKNTKVPAAFLMDICGLKDIKEGGAVINHNQPLVIVNKTGKAKATDVLKLIRKIRLVVHKNCGVKLQIEPALIGFGKKELDIIKV